MGNERVRAPDVPQSLIPRERLSEEISALFETHDVVEIVAAAGSGKTVLAQQFADAFGLPVSWLSLDRTDRSGRRLLEDLGRSLADASEDVTHVVQTSSTRGLTLAETAGLLADEMATTPLLLILDNCETVVGSEESEDVLREFLARSGLTAVLLLSRVEMDFGLPRLRLTGRVGRLGDLQLAMRHDEATELLRQLGRDSEDVGELLVETGGWVAGLVFGARRRGLADGPDQLVAYLNAEVLAALPQAEQDFVIRTALLERVDPRGATWLTGSHGPELLRAISTKRLPAVLGVDGSLTYHPCFREFLLDRLQSSKVDEVHALKARYAEWLERHGHAEDAVEVCIEIADLDAAATYAEMALPALLARADWSTLLRWVDILGDERTAAHPRLLAGQIRALASARRLPEAQRLIRRLEQDGILQRVVEEEPSVIPHMAWAFVWRPSEALALLDRYPGDYRADAIRYAVTAISSSSPVTPPVGREWGEVERFFTWALLVQGRLPELLSLLPTADEWPPPGHYYWSPHALLGLVWQGRIGDARALWDHVPLSVRNRAHTDLWYHLEAWLLLSEGRFEDALEAGQRAVSHSQQTAFGWEPCFEVVVGRALLHLGRTRDARAVLVDAYRRSAAAGELAYAEWSQTFLGLALLRDGVTQESARTLRHALAGQAQANRYLMMPYAGVYLCAAELMSGNADAAADAMDLALEACERLGSDHALRQALEDVPDAGPVAAARGLTRTHSVIAEPSPALAGAIMDILVQTCGEEPGVYVGAKFHPIRRTKVLEFAALLARNDGAVDRTTAQLQLHPESDRRSGGNYFRQVVHQFRRTTGLQLHRNQESQLRLAEDTRIDSTDQRLERLVTAYEQDPTSVGLTELEKALADTEQGYLVASDLEWAEDRRFEIDGIRARGLAIASHVALRAGSAGRARELAKDALDLDPYAETAWQSLLAAEAEAGSREDVRAVFMRMRTALAELGLEPHEDTVRLVNELRAAARTR